MFKNNNKPINPNSAFFLTNAQDTFRHWIKQRITAIFMIPSFILAIYWFQSTTNDVQFDVYNLTSLLAMFSDMWDQRPLVVQIYLIAFFFVLVIHIGEGVDSIIQDYVHHENTKSLSSILLQCVQVLLAKHMYLLILFL